MKQMLTKAPLGKKTPYIDTYTPSLLYPLNRKEKRDLLGIKEALPFHGMDVWNLYEVSWLNMKGKPCVCLVQLLIPSHSEYFIEHKSMKLYFNSLNQTRFESTQIVADTVKKDIEVLIGIAIDVRFVELETLVSEPLSTFEGVCLDGLDITCTHYHPHAYYLATKENSTVCETLYSHLLKTNCLITGQPDWGSIQITYKGAPIDHEGLLKYLISYRHENEFGEPFVERVFMDMIERCNPTRLEIFVKFTRRGGIDFNLYRSTDADFSLPRHTRLVRQ